MTFISFLFSNVTDILSLQGESDEPGIDRNQQLPGCTGQKEFNKGNLKTAVINLRVNLDCVVDLF